MGYALKNWGGLTTFLEDGRVELDTNTVERAIKPQILTRKNALVADSDGGAEHWACIASLPQTRKPIRRRALGRPASRSSVTFPTTAGVDAFLRLAETVTDRAWLASGAALARINQRGPREGVLIADTHAGSDLSSADEGYRPFALSHGSISAMPQPR
ncbi:MAG: transposase [Rhodospirillales bacterium]